MISDLFTVYTNLDYYYFFITTLHIDTCMYVCMYVCALVPVYGTYICHVCTHIIVHVPVVPVIDINIQEVDTCTFNL